MKPPPAPEIPENTPWERFDNAVRMVLEVPKEALLKDESRRQRNRSRSKAGLIGGIPTNVDQSATCWKVEYSRRRRKGPTADAGFGTFCGTDLAQVKAIFQDHSIQHVFMGAGLALEQRLEIVRTVFQNSENTTVRLKDSASGPQGFFPFVRAILSGLQR